VLQMPPHPDLDDYCLRYAAFFHPRLGPAFERTALRLRQHLDSVGIREFQPSLVVLQRDTGRPAWVSTVQGVQQDLVSAAEIDALIAARQFLVHGDAGLLGATLRVPANVLLQLESAFGADGEHSIRLRFAGQSMLPAIDCSPQSLRLVQKVDTAATVADALRDLHAEDTEIPRLLDSVRAAVLRGMLKPVAVSARPTR